MCSRIPGTLGYSNFCYKWDPLTDPRSTGVYCIWFLSLKIICKNWIIQILIIIYIPINCASTDLPTQSTLLYNATKILIRWEQLLVASLDSHTVEETLIHAHPPSSTGEGGGVMRGGLTLQKTKLLLDPDNTPFRFVYIFEVIDWGIRGILKLFYSSLDYSIFFPCM